MTAVDAVTRVVMVSARDAEQEGPMDSPRTPAGRRLLDALRGLDIVGGSEGLPDDLGRPIVEVENEAGSMVANLQLTDDHGLCETQITELVTILKEIERTKAFDSLSLAMRDRVRRAIKTRGTDAAYRGQ